MKQNIFDIIPVFVILAAVVLPNGVPVVAANEPAVKSLNVISYVSGGFGLDERQILRSVAKGNLELSFALRNKEYLDGAAVVIKDESGNTVLETLSDGPLFYVALPAGSYIVQATALGIAQTQTVDVPAKGRAKVYFAWNAADELMSQSITQR